MFIPALPVDSIFSGNSVTGNGTDVESDFIRNRTIQLNLFVNQIISIPFLTTSPVLRIFLSNQGDFRALDLSQSSDSDGESSWKLLLESVPIVNNYDGIIVDIKRQLTSLRNTLRQLQDECVTLSKATLMYAKQLKSTNDKLLLWNKTEKDIADPAKNARPNVTPSLPSYLDAVMDSFAHWTRSSQVNKNRLGIIDILSLIHYDIRISQISYQIYLLLAYNFKSCK
jgi:hypothetical protein